MNARLRRRLHFLWFDADPAPVESSSACLSASFAIVLLAQGSDANALQHAYFYAAICAIAAALKLVGVVAEIQWLRLAGLLLGAIFWITLSYVFVRSVHGSITWLCFAVLAFAQWWAFWRVLRP